MNFGGGRQNAKSALLGVKTLNHSTLSEARLSDKVHLQYITVYVHAALA